MISTAPLPPGTTALLMIDAQEEYFTPGGAMELPTGPLALSRAAGLLEGARRAGAHVIHVRHVTDHPMAEEFRRGSTGAQIRPEVVPRPGEPVFDKRTPSAFAGTQLDEELAARGISTVIIAGFMTPTCCTATAHEALGRRLRTVFSSDATAARGYGPEDHEEVHERALRMQRQLGAEVLSSASIASLLDIAA